MPNASPGGSPRPACDYSKKQRGDGHGRPIGGGSMTKPEFSPFGNDLFGDPIVQAKSGPLAQRFEFPPFSILNAQQGAWQERKGAWLSLGIKSEVGREGSLMMTNQDGLMTNQDGLLNIMRDGKEKTEPEALESGTSVFDPTLCELMYKWFCPPGGQVVDPFAGGSVRGIVAALLGYQYWGCDLRAEQVAANEAQRDICNGAAHQPIWVTGDSRETLKNAPQADLVFTCPPYGDLERYSDDPRDVSTMPYPQFLASYKAILEQSAARLKSNRFLCVVVGDFRDPKSGNYRGFVADTILICRELLKLPFTTRPS